MNNPEELITLKEIQKYIKNEYQCVVTVSTLRNWIKRGLLSRSGHRYILGAKKRSGIWRGWYVTIKELNAFIMELDS